MNDTAEIYSVCRSEIEKDVDALVSTGLEITESTARAIEKQLQTAVSSDAVTDNLISAISDTTDVDTPKSYVVEIFSWATVTSLAAMIGMFFGYTVLSSFVESIAGRYSSMILACLVLPLTATIIIQMYDEDIRYTSPYRDGDVRMVSLEFAVAQGIFVGRCMRDLYLSGQPPMFLTPATISVSFACMPDAAGKNRIALMSFTLSWAIVVNLLYGAIIEDTVTLPFFSLTLLYVLSCGLILQFIFGNVNRNSTVHAYQHAIVSALITVKGIFFLLFGRQIKYT